MNIEHLVSMANQIGTFFASQPNREEAVASVADHLRRFWDPRMRRAIVAHFKSIDAGLEDIVAEAVATIAAEQDIAESGRATDPQAQNPGATGIWQDAGVSEQP